MNRTSIRNMMLIALAVFAGAVHADVTAGPAVTNSGEPAQGFIVAVPPDNNATAANKVAEEPQRECRCAALRWADSGARARQRRRAGGGASGLR